VRALAATALLLLSACSQAPTSPTAAPSASPQAAQSCKLPVWWPYDTTSDIHVGLLPIPGGGVTSPETLSPTTDTSSLSSFQFYGATYFGAVGGWKRLNRALVSPDGTRYTYWNSTGINTDTVHVLDLASGTDTVIYEGTVLYWPIAWTADGIYLVHAIQPRQGAFEKLYRLDPTGVPEPQLVTGSDRHMYQYGWVLVAGGAAWGIDNGVSGEDYTYSVLRLDLTTFEVTTWHGPTGDMLWPVGVDLQHRLYIGDGQQFERIDANGVAVTLHHPGSDALSSNQGPGGVSGFVADATGVWFDGTGGVWRYSNDGAAQEYPAGPPTGIVYLAGPCA
jgi:hypothetical protein